MSKMPPKRSVDYLSPKAVATVCLDFGISGGEGRVKDAIRETRTHGFGQILVGEMSTNIERCSYGLMNDEWRSLAHSGQNLLICTCVIQEGEWGVDLDTKIEDAFRKLTTNQSF